MSLTTNKSKSKDKIKDDFCVNEVESKEIFNFSEGELKIEGTLLKSFSFDSEDELMEIPITAQNFSEAGEIDLNLNKNPIVNLVSKSNPTDDKSCQSHDNKNDILDNRTLKANPNGRTPPVNGEVYDMIRTYTLRRSTVRILSKIKVIHNDDNVYLNTIVDEAIRYYYEYLEGTNK
ncbi:hypothetical protein psyc5s11_18570 [Clostridium gelidum]|uniref:Uncharacterized protein n=1 Tax=Clostridium gelidum TaxID=704125 RepID=A0ABN6IUC5_9CLOT|nr:hypothetical protein [Clostridium gelidum]BCZ45790.1 hypothetical protein psyc5s11_18570 [Clostridium gelidum]